MSRGAEKDSSRIEPLTLTLYAGYAPPAAACLLQPHDTDTEPLFALTLTTVLTPSSDVLRDHKPSLLRFMAFFPVTETVVSHSLSPL